MIMSYVRQISSIINNRRTEKHLSTLVYCTNSTGLMPAPPYPMLSLLSPASQEPYLNKIYPPDKYTEDISITIEPL